MFICLISNNLGEIKSVSCLGVPFSNSSSWRLCKETVSPNFKTCLIHVLLRFYFGHKGCRYRTSHFFERAFIMSALLMEQNCEVVKAYFCFLFLFFGPYGWVNPKIFAQENLGFVLLYLCYFFTIKSYAHWHNLLRTIREDWMKNTFLFQKY